MYASPQFLWRFKTRTESETINKNIADYRLICCARSRNTSFPSVKQDVGNDRGTRIRSLLSVEKKPLTSRGRKAKRSQPNRGTRIVPFILSSGSRDVPHFPID
ncbi:hypothetical protein AVEN_130823-1 [Araneus ventricosus]|uniref:Uncharacterized protein n=1 Tax=Araneus ventricosus TaxID=182803 RepID=A0A4Y2W4S7_ARAVE|nr:hypothetical protein AVEN_130823-1 [Araneus ventricosus]